MTQRKKLPLVLFVLIFSVILTVQVYTWKTRGGIDVDLWAKGAAQLADGTLPPFWGPIPSHPGTTIIIPAAFLMLFGVPSILALELTSAILTSLCIAIILYLCYLLRPRSLWWIGAAMLL